MTRKFSLPQRPSSDFGFIFRLFVKLNWLLCFCNGWCELRFNRIVSHCEYTYHFFYFFTSAYVADGVKFFRHMIGIFHWQLHFLYSVGNTLTRTQIGRENIQMKVVVWMGISTGGCIKFFKCALVQMKRCSNDKREHWCFENGKTYEFSFV